MAKDNFYNEIDKKKEKGGACTCQTMLVLFGFLFVLIVFLIWFFLKR